MIKTKIRNHIQGIDFKSHLFDFCTPLYTKVLGRKREFLERDDRPLESHKTYLSLERATTWNLVAQREPFPNLVNSVIHSLSSNPFLSFFPFNLLACVPNIIDLHTSFYHLSSSTCKAL